MGGECGGDTAQAVECGGDTAQAELSNALLDREASTKCCVSGLDVSGLDVVRGTERAETGEETRGGNQEETRRKPGGNQTLNSSHSCHLSKCQQLTARVVECLLSLCFPCLLSLLFLQHGSVPLSATKSRGLAGIAASVAMPVLP